MVIGSLVYWYESGPDIVRSGVVLAGGRYSLLIGDRSFEACVRKDDVCATELEAYEAQRQHLEEEMQAASDNLDLAREKVSECWKRISELKKASRAVDVPAVCDE